VWTILLLPAVVEVEDHCVGLYFHHYYVIQYVMSVPTSDSVVLLGRQEGQWNVFGDIHHKHMLML
jgi:hypothetical protein